MKKFLAVLLASLLIAGLCMPAHAVTAQYKSTQAFADILDSLEITYSLSGPDSDGDELISIENEFDNGYECTFHVYFNSHEENCYIRVWNIISYDDADFSKVLRACNTLNNQYKYVRFYADESDNTVTASLDLIFRDNDVDQIVLEALLTAVSILEDAYPALEIYNK